MAHDLVISGGTIVDGTGSEPYVGDVAVDGDRITEVGEVADGADRTIDAEGLLVTPGFIDVHTHLDAQIGWDPDLTSSSWHGVTTTVIGNCGVTFAPCHPGDREFLAGMMESVEDIPKEAILSGLPWDWESYSGYLDTLERLPKAVNVGGLVGHCAVRTYVMGERALTEDTATPDELDQMVGLVDDAMAAGALGFSVSRTPLHRVPDGRLVPGTTADALEMVRIGDVLGRYGRGVFQGVMNIGTMEMNAAEFDWMGEVAGRSGRPVVVSLAQTDLLPDVHTDVLDRIESAKKEGADIRAQMLVRGTGLVVGLANLTPWLRSPGWRKLREMDLPARLALLDDPAEREALVADAKEHPCPFDLYYCFPLGTGRPEYMGEREDSLAALAERAGEHPAETFLRMCRESDGRLLFTIRFFNQDNAEVEKMLADPGIVLGLGDAGAHVGQVMDAGWTTFYLAYWLRDRQKFPMGEGIRRITSDLADLFGYRQPGNPPTMPV